MADWIDAGRVKIIPRGEYSNTVQYEVDDIVTYHHYAYICIKDCIGIHPIDDETSEYWEQFGSAPKVATLTSTGIVKPDGTTISIDEDGTIHGAGGTAESISFDNSGTGLEATNVQDALEEQNRGITDLSDSVDERFEETNESITPYTKVTQAQYDALKSAGTLAKNTNYIITDKPYSADDVLDLATIKSRGASGTLKASDVASASALYETDYESKEWTSQSWEYTPSTSGQIYINQIMASVSSNARQVIVAPTSAGDIGGFSEIFKGKTSCLYEFNGSKFLVSWIGDNVWVSYVYLVNANKVTFSIEYR